MLLVTTWGQGEHCKQDGEKNAFIDNFSDNSHLRWGFKAS